MKKLDIFIYGYNIKLDEIHMLPQDFSLLFTVI